MPRLPRGEALPPPFPGGGLGPVGTSSAFSGKRPNTITHHFLLDCRPRLYNRVQTPQRRPQVPQAQHACELVCCWLTSRYSLKSDITIITPTTLFNITTYYAYYGTPCWSIVSMKKVIALRQKLRMANLAMLASWWIGWLFHWPHRRQVTQQWLRTFFEVLQCLLYFAHHRLCFSFIWTMNRCLVSEH